VLVWGTQQLLVIPVTERSTKLLILNPHASYASFSQAKNMHIILWWHSPLSEVPAKDASKENGKKDQAYQPVFLSRTQTTEEVHI